MEGCREKEEHTGRTVRRTVRRSTQGGQSGGAHREDYTEKSAQGRIHREQHTGSSTQGGVHREECMQASGLQVDGLHVVVHLWLGLELG